MKVAIIDYGSGNLRSAAKAFERAGRDAGLAADILVTSDPDAVRGAERIVLPGVGAFGDCRAGLDAIPGMVEALEEAVRKEGKPFFGICVGMQLMAERGLEHGSHEGLGWLKGDVVKIEPSDPALKIPHMGWNELDVVNGHPLLEEMPATHAYFVHSYAFAVADPDALVARVDYGGPVTAMVARDNMVGTQFHPEKSQALGLALIGNFLKWKP
ncbi:imidazole glycerol phosphate synthase subunit HisH [Parvibaculum sp.]|uniref:imidazole glycerol phosphate synthase subunit HisH n=1 Tax=Parvibaculum sp. TaxID=2024848 RepID=UPI000C4EB111|nr:imidazole glycerol phosphate synthase subunit HisH [Parvibaculum sp.]HAC59396.1 imidazole glycerol phosphate synthase subunit HisH [Rhodobiaceae bacterium]MAU61234.1 imidazole glycerol phosphate synthase subunit HisH [Parvibaculum sp.]MAU61333.1 imidazole glycerol phosphate synthase subunit HisH [Parvibaculum sp.]MBO6668396.1 imidazole glycerol phosphate synthase subunit HisH [Parvibaculum sp.]MBO6691357.1 imidazole glycerol phosphate synthase subunit HisH [Parvibaculum sp.]